MEFALKRFKERVSFIERQIKTQRLTHELVPSRLQTDLSDDDSSKLSVILSNTTDEKIYQYTANVITLYGGLECFVEEVVEEYLKEVFSICPSYKQLRGQFGLSEYLLFGISLINHAGERKFKRLSKTDVLKSLFETVVNDKSSSVRSEAYIDYGGGNYRHETIMNCFIQLGMKDIKTCLKLYEPLSSYIKKKGIGDSDTVYIKIDDLVERRNELAHGGNTIEVLDSGVFSEYLSFLSLYTETINNFIKSFINQHKWNMSNDDIIDPRVYSGNIVVLKDDDVGLGFFLKKGQPVLILRDSKYYDGVICNIQVEGVDYSEYKKEAEGIEIGLKILSECIITKECKFKIIS